MEGISQDTLNVLRSASSAFDGPVLARLCELVIAEAQGVQRSSSSTTEKVLAKHFGGLDAAKVKQAHGALLEYVLDSAKSDLEPEEIASSLEELGASEKLAGPLVDGFRDNKAAIRERLHKIGHSFPQVTGMNWRLDYTLRSSTGGKVMLPTYVISLKTMDGAGEEAAVQFTCNREQLKDFLRKVEDAETQVERAIGSTK